MTYNIRMQAEPPANAAVGDVYYNTFFCKILVWNGNQWAVVEEKKIPTWDLREKRGLWLLTVPADKKPDVSIFIEQNDLKALEFNCEFVFRDFDEAALVRLKFQ